MKKLRQAARFLLLMLLVPVFVTLAILAMPLVLLGRLWDYAVLRWHCWRTNVWTYLVCSPRRGWNEFLVNNVMPTVPAGLGCIWTTRHGAKSGTRAENLLVWSGIGQAKPYLAEVMAFRVRFKSLHDRIRPFKARSQIEPSARREIESLLAEEIRIMRSV